MDQRLIVAGKLADVLETSTSVEEAFDRLGISEAHKRLKGDNPTPDETELATMSKKWDEAIKTCATVEEVIEWLGLAEDHAKCLRWEPEYAAMMQAMIQHALDHKRPNYAPVPAVGHVGPCR